MTSILLISLGASGAAALACAALMFCRSPKRSEARNGQSASLDGVFTPEEEFELRTRMRLVVADEWMRAGAVLHHTAARLVTSRVPIGMVDLSDPDAVRIVFSDGTTLVAEHPDPSAAGAIGRAAQLNRVLLCDVGETGQWFNAEFDVDGTLMSLPARRLVVR